MKRQIICSVLAACTLFTVGCAAEKSSKTNTATTGSTASQAVTETTTQIDANGITTATTTLNSTNKPNINNNNNNSTTVTQKIQGTTKHQQTTYPKTTAVKTTQAAPVDEIAKALGTEKKKLNSVLKSPLTGDVYLLKWIDDFSGTTLNTNYWTAEDNSTYYNGELNYKSPKNLVVQDDMLTIYGKKESYKGKDYTGAHMNSHHKVEYQYGRIEMRAKLPYGKGMWPAFWTMGSQRGWPWGGEIDIMEMIGDTDGGKWNYNGDSKAMWALHWCKPDAVGNDAYGKYKQSTSLGTYTLPGFVKDRTVPGLEKLADKWHVYGIEWTKTKIISYFDNIKIKEVDITDPTMSYAFHNEHYMLLNLSIGGGWPGSPDASTVFPQKYMIDWVKVWQKV